MAKGSAATPKLVKGQVVMLSLYDRQGKPRNSLAAKCTRFHGKSGIIASWASSPPRGTHGFVYRVKTEDGKVLQLTEDCLTPVTSPRERARAAVTPARGDVPAARSSITPLAGGENAPAKPTIESEVNALIQEEIRNAAMEVAEEHKTVLWAAVAEYKRIIREVLDEQKVLIRGEHRTRQTDRSHSRHLPGAGITSG